MIIVSSQRKKAQGSENMWIMMSAALVIICILVVGTMLGNMFGTIANATNLFCEKNPDKCRLADIKYTEQDIVSMDSSTYLACIIESIATGELVGGCEKRVFNYKEDSWLPSSGKMTGMFFASSGVTSGPPLSLVGMITSGSSDLMKITGMASSEGPILYTEEQEMDCLSLSGYPEFEYEEDCRFYNLNCKDQKQNVWYTFDAVSEKWEWWTDNKDMVRTVINGHNKEEEKKIYANLETLDTALIKADPLNDIIKEKLKEVNGLTHDKRYKEGLKVLQNALDGIYYEEQYLSEINSVLSDTGLALNMNSDLRQLEVKKNIENTIFYQQLSDSEKSAVDLKSKDIKDVISKLNKKLGGIDDDHIDVHYLHPTFGEDFKIKYRENDNRDEFINTGFDSAVYECTLSNFYLPQEVSDWKAWIKGFGDPLYLVYWQQFPKDASDSWSGGAQWVSNIIDIGFAWIGVGGTIKGIGKGLKAAPGIIRNGASLLTEKLITRPIKSKLFVGYLSKELTEKAMKEIGEDVIFERGLKIALLEFAETGAETAQKKLAKELAEAGTRESLEEGVKLLGREMGSSAANKLVKEAEERAAKELGEAFLQRGYAEVLDEAVEKVTKEYIGTMTDAQVKRLGRKFARSHGIWFLPATVNERQLGEMAVREMASKSTLSAIEKQGLGTVVDVTFMPLFGKNGMTTRQIYKTVLRSPDGSLVTKHVVNSFDSAGKLIGTKTIGGEVAEEAAKLSGTTLNRIANAFIDGHKEALRLWSDRLRRWGAVTLTAYAIGVMDARTQRNTPESNKLVVSIPVVGTLQENSVITKAPTQLFVKTKDFIGSSLKPFYLASPCYANLEIKLAPVKCGYFGTTFGGLRELASSVDNCEKPDEEDTISAEEDCYRAIINGDILDRDIISNKIVELTGIESGGKRIDVQLDGAPEPISIDVVEKSKGNDIRYDEYIEERVEALRIFQFGISNWDLVKDDTSLEMFNTDIAYIRDPISGIRFVFDFSNLAGASNCGSSAMDFLKMSIEPTTRCDVQEMTGLVMPPEMMDADMNAENAYYNLSFGGKDALIDLSLKNSVLGDYTVKVGGEGKCAAYNPPEGEYKNGLLACNSVAYKLGEIPNVPLDEESIYNFMENGDEKTYCCNGVNTKQWQEMSESEKRDLAKESVENIKLCIGLESAYFEFNSKYNSDSYHIRHKNLNCRIEMKNIVPQGDILKDVECNEEGKMVWFEYQGTTYIQDPATPDGEERLSHITDKQNENFYDDILGNDKTKMITSGTFDTEAMDRYCYLYTYYKKNDNIFFSRSVGLTPYDGIGSEDNDEPEFVETETSELKLWAKEDSRYDISFIDTSKDGVVDTITVSEYDTTWDKIKWAVGIKEDPKIILMDTDTENDGIMNLLKIKDCKIRGQIVYVDKIDTNSQYNFCIDEKDRVSTIMRWAPEICGAVGAVVAGVFSWGTGAAGGYKVGEVVGAVALTGYILVYEQRHGRSDFWPGKV
ncbi:MAG: hypothetical protein JW716_00485 [Candidatus Aenigmarchaeota archaeon]|nr:hypothetical protein [Candidatus Aenigmarchaeota archaeon]